MTSGIAKGCKDSRGGIKLVLLANVSEVTSFTEGVIGTSSVPSGEITGITMSGASNYFYEYVPTKGSSNWVETIQSSIANGSAGFEQVLTMTFAKNEAAKRNQVALLAQGEVYGIVQDYNGKFFLLGQFNGMELSGGNGQTGTALTDLNGWILNFSANEPDPAREVASAAIVDNGDGTWSPA